MPKYSLVRPFYVTSVFDNGAWDDKMEVDATLSFDLGFDVNKSLKTTDEGKNINDIKV